MPFVADTQEELPRRSSGFVPDPPAPKNWFDQLKSTASDVGQSVSDTAQTLRPVAEAVKNFLSAEPAREFSPSGEDVARVMGGVAKDPTVRAVAQSFPDAARLVPEVAHRIFKPAMPFMGGQPLPDVVRVPLEVAATELRKIDPRAANLLEAGLMTAGAMHGQVGAAVKQAANIPRYGRFAGEPEAARFANARDVTPEAPRALPAPGEPIAAGPPRPARAQPIAEIIKPKAAEPVKSGFVPDEAVKPGFTLEPVANAPTAKVNTFYDDAVKAYTSTTFDERFGNMHGTGATPKSAEASLNKNLTAAKEQGTWRSVEHPTPAPKAKPERPAPYGIQPRGFVPDEAPKGFTRFYRADVEGATKPGGTHWVKASDAERSGYFREGGEYGKANLYVDVPNSYPEIANTLDLNNYIPTRITIPKDSELARQVKPIAPPPETPAVTKPLEARIAKLEAEVERGNAELRGKPAAAPETPRAEVPVPERFQQTAPAEPLKTKPLRTIQGEIGDAVERNVEQVTQSEGNLEYKGKEYEGAVREGKKLRLKDSPDKVIGNPAEMLKVEEKVPFDIAPEIAPDAPQTVTSGPIGSKPPELMTPGEAAQGLHLSGSPVSARDAHRFTISKALDDGKPVNADAMVVYEDLRAKAEELGYKRSGDRYVLGEKASPSFEQTPAGQQAVIPGAEARSVPDAPLRAKRAQTEKPLELEQPGIAAKEPGLFEPKPIPSKNLAPEEIAAADEMRGELGTPKLSTQDSALSTEKPLDPVAERIAQLEKENAELRERKAQKEVSQKSAVASKAPALRRLADGMDAQIEAKMNPASANQNPTHRRAGIIDSMMRDGDRLKAIQTQLRAIADASEAGTLPDSLREVSSRADLETMSGKFYRPSVHNSNLNSILEVTKSKRGLTEDRAQVARANGRLTSPGSSATILYPNDLDAISRVAKAAQDAKPYDAKGVLEDVAKARRMAKLGIETEEKFNKAKADLEQLTGPKTQADPTARRIRELESQLIGTREAGRFFTPKAVAEQVVDAADIRPGMKVLEPSAGKGDLADAIKAAEPEADLSTIEIRSNLREILELKGHKSAGNDFLELKDGDYDRIVMNPPFENGAEMDHVRHAYELLKPGGKLVSIMSEGPFGRTDKKATEFREFLSEVGGESEKLPDKSFTGAGTITQTGVSTRLVTIEKPKDAPGAPNEVAALLSKESAKPQTPTEIETLLRSVYHGSPHTFDKFDISKVGTGEGAQTYGHGLYFAENPKVAETYAKKDPWKMAGPGPHLLKGETYSAKISDATVSKMLDWDKPLSEQPKVLEIVKSVAGPGGQPEKWTGEEAYHALENMVHKPGDGAGDRQRVSELLAQHGIPGIRYLDQGSRSADMGYRIIFPDGKPSNTRWKTKAEAETALGNAGKQGRDTKDAKIEFIDDDTRSTRNYVVFDPDILTEVKRNGGEVAALLSAEKPKAQPAQPLTDILEKPTDTTTTEYSRQLRKQADALSKESMKMMDRVPPGQPVSSTADRNLRERAADKMRKAGNLIKQAEKLEQDISEPTKGRNPIDILKSERGSIRFGPVRMRDGKPVEAPTVDEVKAAVDELTKPVSSKRLIAGGLFEESTKTLSKTMGAEGTELGKLSKAVRNDSELEASAAYQPIKAQLKKMDAKQRANLVEVLEGKSAPLDEKVKTLATTTRIALNKVADRAAQVGLEIKNPVTGEKYPFQPRENFFPHMFGKEMGQIARDPKGRAMLKEKIKASLERAGKEVDDVAVEKALQGAIKTSRTRYGHLEMARIADLGDYSKDAGAVLSRYFADAYRRVNIAEKFGPDLAKGEKLLSEIGLNKGDKAESFARSYFQKVTSTEPEGNLAVKDAVRFATNFQAATKLGQAVISNLSQPAYTAIVAGAKNAAKGYGAAMTKEGRTFADKIILSDTMTDFLKDTGEHIDRSKMGKAADTVLRRTGFTAVERMNRTVSANAGKFFAEDTFEKLLKKPDSARLRYHLEKMNVDVEAALERGELSEKDLLRAGQNIVNRTQYKTDVTEIPLFWSSDAGRLLTQFKKFQFKAGQMMKDEVLAEMKRGNAKPFIRAALILPIAGLLTVTLKDSVRFGDQTERDRNIADYLAAVGTFGAFTDAFAGSGRQPVKGLPYLAGPTLGDAGSLWEAAFIEAPKGNLRPGAKFVARQVPVVGPSIRQLFNEPKEPKSSAENSQLLKELGIDSPLQKEANRRMLKDLGLQ